VPRFSALNDHDFEVFVADLFHAVEDQRYEVFARGADGGVDLRHLGDDGIRVVQCKHAVFSTVAQLVSEAKKERLNLAALDPQPVSYRFVTSRRLTAANKVILGVELAPYIGSDADVLGEDDLSLLLGEHAEVERRHIKLWMPSSAGLQALLNASVGSRARTLAQDIERSLPLWVHNTAFDEARQMLRDHGTCVIAGAAGIGKTTLAKLLVGDAIDAGYELVAVSGDIEEAWSVHDPSIPQIIYYDDFLGRSALEPRLGRREEDRLVQLMRLTGRSEATKFVLTTREYILQHAHQIHDRLEEGDFDRRKVLLELPAYTRRQRAEIFYSHAHASGALSGAARAALLVDDAYARIIDHPNYNPRQIEWITGMSGHTITNTEDQDYVTFAVEALDDGTRLWRHGFENELIDAPRALLFTLAGLPNQVALDDLERAFNAHCAAADISVRGRAFEKAMAVIDDSFVRTSAESGTLFVAFYDPSVADFVIAYLNDSLEDAVTVLRGSVFFEQTLRLIGSLRLTTDCDTRLILAAAEAVERTDDSPSTEWQLVRYGHEQDPRRIKPRASWARRAARLGHLSQDSAFTGDPAAIDLIKTTYVRAVERAKTRWRDGYDDPLLAIALVREMLLRSEDVADAGSAAKGLILNGLAFAQAFVEAEALHDLVPAAFDEHEWADVRSRLHDVAHEQLNNWEEMSDVSEIEEITDVARELNVELDAEVVREATRKLAARIDYAEERAMEEASWPRDEDVVADPPAPESDDTDAVRAIFSRLAAE
jgi:hypothetical protein